VVADYGGLDILTTGGYHLTRTSPGVPGITLTQRWKGLDTAPDGEDPVAAAFIPGQDHARFDYKTWLAVVTGKVDMTKPARVRQDLADRAAGSAASALVKFSTCSAQVLSFLPDNHTQYDLDDQAAIAWPRR
jgi:hypothetical protein